MSSYFSITIIAIKSMNEAHGCRDCRVPLHSWPVKIIIFRGVPHKWHSAPSMGPMEGWRDPKMVVTTFCTYLPYDKIFKNAIFTMDFAVYNP